MTFILNFFTLCLVLLGVILVVLLAGCLFLVPGFVVVLLGSYFIADDIIWGRCGFFSDLSDFIADYGPAMIVVSLLFFILVGLAVVAAGMS